jgi:L-threonylcarbamoyladenylate synthase
MSRITIQQAVERLCAGDVVALPTETVYGLSARIDSEPALMKVFAVKERPSFDPLIVHVSDVRQARALCSEWPAIYDLLTEEFWPGPLTLIAPKLPSVSNTITSGLLSVAFRCPQHPVFLEAIARVGVPLAAPSANRFGRTSPTTAAHVEEEFDELVAVVDGGACEVGVESTVLTAEKAAGDKWQLKILRPGGISREALRDFLDEHQIKFEISRAASPASPGNLKEHYQPKSPVVILNGKSWDELAHAATEKILNRKVTSAVELRLPRTPQEAARVLYSEFRKLSRSADHVLWITRKESHHGEDWEAVWDRIERASSATLA